MKDELIKRLEAYLAKSGIASESSGATGGNKVANDKQDENIMSTLDSQSQSLLANILSFEQQETHSNCDVTSTPDSPFPAMLSNENSNPNLMREVVLSPKQFQAYPASRQAAAENDEKDAKKRRMNTSGHGLNHNARTTGPAVGSAGKFVRPLI